MPLMPVILPLVQSISVAASPISSPPMAALTGVKYSKGSPCESEVDEMRDLQLQYCIFILPPTLYRAQTILDQDARAL